MPGPARRLVPASVASTIVRISSVSAAVFCAGAVPFVRRMPFMVLRTIALCVGDSSPTALCASAMAFNRPLNAPDLQTAGAFGDIGRHASQESRASGHKRARLSTMRRTPASRSGSPVACSLLWMPGCTRGPDRATEARTGDGSDGERNYVRPRARQPCLMTSMPGVMPPPRHRDMPFHPSGPV